MNFRLFACLLSILVLALSACTHRVEVAPPAEPITINMNIKIDHEVRIKVDKDLEKIISEDSELF